MALRGWPPCRDSPGPSPHKSGHHVHICDTGSFVLDYAGRIHCCYCGSCQCIWLPCFLGGHNGSGRWQIPQQACCNPLKPGDGAISSLGLGDPGNNVKSDFCMACFHSLAPQCWALLSTLWLLHCCLSPPRVGWVHPAGFTGWVGCSTYIQPGKLLCVTSPFSFSLCCKGGIPDSSAGSLTMAMGVASSSLGSSVGATSSVDTSAGVSSSVGPSISCGMGGFQICQPAH